MKMHEIFGMDAAKNNCTPSPLFRSMCLVGIEHELENSSSEDMDWSSDYWKAESDGSLRMRGIEYVLKAPLAGVELQHAINTLSRYVRRSDMQANERTSTHLHIDARDMNVKQLVTFFVVYTTFERAIFSLCDQSRMDNNFCVPTYKSGGVIGRVRAVNNDPDSVSRMQELASSDYRYAAMNMAALQRFGSLEFRMRETLVDDDQLIDWINIFLSIKDFAMMHGNSPVEDVIARLSKMEQARVTKFIFGEKLAMLLGRAHDIRSSVGEGLALARHTFCGTHESLVSIRQYAEQCDRARSPLLATADALGNNIGNVVGDLAGRDQFYYGED